MLEDELNTGEDDTVDDDSVMMSKMVMEELMKLQDPLSHPNAVKSMDFDRGEEIAKAVEEELGHGKRKRKANTLYTCSFWLDHSGD
ncbi:hypothetical protein BS17DRAFT_782291 [Gyrodon lividus]|nr:hypothetical protein BS17DRAFT_782291 [Gyrodon lividus]